MTTAAEGSFCVFENSDILAQEVADWLCVILGEEEDDRLGISLSGGSTPKKLYSVLASQPFIDRFPWQRVHWFWGDERFVPPDDPDSNYRMARQAMLDHAPVPPANIHPIPTVGISPERAAQDYEKHLRAWLGGEELGGSRPLFHVTLLGLGTDGHTASLMPGSRSLSETERWTAVVPKEPGHRITLTYPAIQSSAHIAFLVAGADKKEMLKRAQAGDLSLPAAHIVSDGDLTWFADRAAAE